MHEVEEKLKGQITNKPTVTDARNLLPTERISHFCLLCGTLVQHVSTREGGSWRGVLLGVSDTLEQFAQGLPMSILTRFFFFSRYNWNIESQSRIFESN